MRLCIFICIAKLFLIQIICTMNQSPQEKSSTTQTPTSQKINSFFSESKSSTNSLFLEEANAFEQFNPLETAYQSSEASTETPNSKPTTPQKRTHSSETTYQKLCSIIKLQQKKDLKKCFKKWKQRYENEQEKKWDILDDKDKWDFVERSTEQKEEQNKSFSKKSFLNSFLQKLQPFTKI